jgi:hypothetical protein
MMVRAVASDVGRALAVRVNRIEEPNTCRSDRDRNILDTWQIITTM